MPLQLLNAYTAGGMVIQNSDPGAGTGIGVWSSNPDGSIGVSLEQFLFMPPPVATGPGGPPPPTGNVHIVASVQLDGTGSAFRGQFRFTVTEMDGTVLQTGTGTVTATRLQVEAL